MDIENERLKLKLLLVAAVLFLVSIYFSYGELKYALRGSVVQGDVARTYRTTVYTKWDSHEKLVIEYRFVDADGESRKGADTLALDWPVPANGKVMVEYMGDQCRLVGNNRRAWVWFFFAMLAVMAVMVFRLWSEAREATRPHRPAVARR